MAVLQVAKGEMVSLQVSPKEPKIWENWGLLQPFSRALFCRFYTKTDGFCHKAYIEACCYYINLSWEHSEYEPTSVGLVSKKICSVLDVLTHLWLFTHPFSITDTFAAAPFTSRQLLIVGHVVVDTQTMIQCSERAGDITGWRRGVLLTSGQWQLATATTVSPPTTVEAPRSPVDGGVVDDGGQDGVFVCKGGGEGPWFVSMGDLEDQTLMEAVVVVVVDLVPVVLRGLINRWVKV